jgi:hypothetical protein
VCVRKEIRPAGEGVLWTEAAAVQGANLAATQILQLDIGFLRLSLKTAENCRFCRAAPRESLEFLGFPDPF